MPSAVDMCSRSNRYIAPGVCLSSHHQPASLLYSSLLPTVFRSTVTRFPHSLSRIPSFVIKMAVVSKPAGALSSLVFLLQFLTLASAQGYGAGSAESSSAVVSTTAAGYNAAPVPSSSAAAYVPSSSVVVSVPTGGYGTGSSSSSSAVVSVPTPTPSAGGSYGGGAGGSYGGHEGHGGQGGYAGGHSGHSGKPKPSGHRGHSGKPKPWGNKQPTGTFLQLLSTCSNEQRAQKFWGLTVLRCLEITSIIEAD